MLQDERNPAKHQHRHPELTPLLISTSCSSGTSNPSLHSNDDSYSPQEQEQHDNHQGVCSFWQRQRTSCTNYIQRNQVTVNLSVSILLGLVSGSMYGYGRYARDLKDVLQLNQFQLERFGILLDTGNYMGHPLTGYIYDHYGPQISCVSGAAIVFLSYGMIHWTVVHQGTTDDSSWLASLPGVLDVGFFMVGLGTGLGYIAALASTTKTFRSTPRLSLAVGVVASGYALCSTLVGLSYGWLGLEHFFLFWAVLIGVVNLLGAVTYENQDEGDSGSDDDSNSSPLKSPARSSTTSSTESDTDEEEDYSDVEQAGSYQASEESPHRVEISVVHHEPASQQSWSALCSVDFWILFCAFACCTGCGLFIINNVSTMVQSMGGQDTDAGRLVILLSFANCFGRIFIGSLADRPQMSKLVLLGSASLVMAGALFLSAYIPPQHAQLALLATVTLVASAYGGSWVLAVGILSDWFGTRDFGKNYGILAMGPALSGMIFNSASAWLYEQNTSHDSVVCVGPSCYHGAFQLTGAAALVCAALLCVLGCRRR